MVAADTSKCVGKASGPRFGYRALGGLRGQMRGILGFASFVFLLFSLLLFQSSPFYSSNGIVVLWFLGCLGFSRCLAC